jgi:hypothetical protein
MSNGESPSFPPGQGGGTGAVIAIMAAPQIIEIGAFDDSVVVIQQDSTITVTIMASKDVPRMR